MRWALVLVSVAAAALVTVCGSEGGSGDDRGASTDTTDRTSLTEKGPEGTARLRGMYVYFADAGVFTDCGTRRRFPVAKEQDNAALERAYLEAREGPRQAVLVTLEGRIATRPDMEGYGEEEVLVVDRFDRVWPSETCGGRAPLANTRWALVELGGHAVSMPPERSEPYVQFDLEEGKVEGLGWCNRLQGGFEVEGDALRIGPLAATRMACPQGMEDETSFLEALDSATRFRIDGETLELYDDTGLLARFESRFI